MKPVDCHCHLDYSKFDEDREEVIERSSESLEFVLNAGLNPESNQKTLELAREHEVIYPALGIHPTYTEDFERLDEVLEQIEEEKPDVIGEIGLDHHHVTEKDMRERQEQVFRTMLEKAEELAVPVVVHTRSAEEQSVNILKEYDVPVHLHSFNGNLSLAKEAVENGWYIGVSTQVLYSSRVRKLVDELPLENLLLETDSPFLYQGERNEPLNVRESAEEIASLKGLEVEEVVKTTTRNGHELFGF